MIGSFLTGFGTVGIIALKGFDVTNPLIHVGMSLGAAVGVAFLVGFLLMKLLQLQSSSEIKTSDLEGTTGKVTVEIQPGRIGQVAVTAKGSRITYPARSDHNKRIPRHAQVLVIEYTSGTLWVTPTLDEELRQLEELDGADSGTMLESPKDQEMVELTIDREEVEKKKD